MCCSLILVNSLSARQRVDYSPRVGLAANRPVSFVNLYLDIICIILQLRHICLYVIMMFIVSGDDNQTLASSSAVFSRMCSKANRPIVLVLCLSMPSTDLIKWINIPSGIVPLSLVPLFDILCIKAYVCATCFRT